MYKRNTCFPSKLSVIGLWYRSDRENGHISLIKQVEYQLVKRNQWHSDRGNGKYLYDKVLFFLWYSSYDFRILCGCPGYNKPCVVIYFHFSIFVIVWSTLFDYQRIIFNSHENGQRIRKCQAVQNHYIPHAFK